MSNPPTAAEQEAARAQASMNHQEEMFKKVSKDHQSAVKAWEKLTVKQKKITTSADSAVAKLEKQVQVYEAQSDKTHKKVNCSAVSDAFETALHFVFLRYVHIEPLRSEVLLFEWSCGL